MAKFKKGDKPWNKGLKGIRLSPHSEFKKGVTVGENHPSWKGGEQIFTKDCVYLRVSVECRVRRPVKTYENVHGDIPKNWIIYHLNGNRYDDSVENLIALPRAILMKINSGRLNANYENIKKEIEKFLIETNK